MSLVHYGRHGIPDVVFNRLNEHYRPAIELAQLILRSVSFELKHGHLRSISFLVDMNRVFENFVVVALREALRLSPKVLVQGAKGKPLYLDDDHRVKLEPDVSWWEDGGCSFVGDVKYKLLSGNKNGDLYQMLAYLCSTGLSSGLLVYAAGEQEPLVHKVGTHPPRPQCRSPGVSWRFA